MSGRKFLIGFYVCFHHVYKLTLFDHRQFVHQFIEDNAMYLGFMCKLILQKFICRNTKEFAILIKVDNFIPLTPRSITLICVGLISTNSDRYS